MIGKPIWDAYLKGEETDEKAVMKKITEAVKAEMSRG